MKEDKYSIFNFHFTGFLSLLFTICLFMFMLAMIISIQMIRFLPYNGDWIVLFVLSVAKIFIYGWVLTIFLPYHINQIKLKKELRLK